jgi:hypothetical protein
VVLDKSGTGDLTIGELDELVQNLLRFQGLDFRRVVFLRMIGRRRGDCAIF